MFDLYKSGSSFFHRVPAGLKILALAICGTVLFVIDSPMVIAVFAAIILLLYRLSNLHIRDAWSQVRPVAWILILLFVVQFAMNDIATAILVAGRFAGLLALAGLITLTTKTSDMINAMERGFAVLGFIGINPAKVSLALSLALRFVPVLATITGEVREAQKSRGLDNSIIAIAIPLVVRMLRMADQISEAMEARSYDSSR
jgi:biotin transport system permease protein